MQPYFIHHESTDVSKAVATITKGAKVCKAEKDGYFPPLLGKTKARDHDDV